MIRKIYDAKINDHPYVTLWGDGSPLREFTYSSDIPEILIFLLEKYDDPDPINIGNTAEYSISEVAKMIIEIMKFQGEAVWDKNMPSGQFRKPSSNQKLVDLGWSIDRYTPLRAGLEKSCKWYLENHSIARGLN